MDTTQLRQTLVGRLEALGEGTPYVADANEPDPRYLGYGVRRPAMQALLREYRAAFKALSRAEALSLVHAFIDSGYGEQKSLAFELLSLHVDYFEPDRLHEFEAICRRLHGWSKIDSFAGNLLQRILLKHPKDVVALAARWAKDPDHWMRRASVVVYTRKIAASGTFVDAALANCEQLKLDEEDMVRKGVGWCLKDLMRADRPRLIEYVISLRRQGVSSVVTLYAIRDLKGAERQRVLAAS